VTSVEQFVHLHVHTEYSILDGAAKLKPLIKEVEQHGMPAVGMTDHGNMFGSFEMWDKTRGSDVKPILGIEAYIAPESRFTKKQVFWGQASQRGSDSGGEGGDVSGGGRFTHMTMWAKNATGLRNLFKLSSLASIDGYYSKPRMDQEIIAANPEGIVATTGCPSGAVQTRLRLGQYDEAIKVAAEYRDIFGPENYFVEVMDHGLAIERSVREGLIKISKELGLRPVATNDSHYVTADQAEPHDVLLCIGTGKNTDDPNRLRFGGSGYYVKSASELRSYWDTELPGACDSTLLIAEMVAPDAYDEVFNEVDRMPQFGVPEGETQASWLRKEVARGTAYRFGDNPDPAVHERLELELGLMESLGFSSYFLIVADICRHARDNGIRVGPGRGSATGSMVAYVLRITELDPIEHMLLFERFLNPERISPPDIDLDFDDRRRGDMIRYVTAKYGEPSVAQVLTFGTIKTKAAIKDSSRVLGYPFAMGERITKALPPAVMAKDIPLAGIFDETHERYNEAGEIRALYASDPDVKKVIDTARGIEGLTRGTGVHACAVIIGAQPLIDVIPIHKRDSDGAIITGFPYPDCERMGLLKMDFLGLRNLTVIADTIANVRETRGIEIDLDKQPLADKPTFELMARGETLGVFQLDNAGMRSLLKSMVPTKFGDIAAVLALYRPGPMAANAHIDYADRKNGRKPVVPIHPELEEALEPILGETYGLVVYQEQVMAIARTLAGYSLGGADLLRRAMGKKKKEILDAEFEKFSAGMAANGYSKTATQAVWDVLVPFSGYGFNKSHTAGYGIVSFWTAYLKANYPAEFMAALLTSVGDNKDTMAIYLSECRRMGIKVMPPDVNDSSLHFTPVGTDVRFGLGAIRNVGENVVASIVKTRSAKLAYTSFSDFLDKSDITVCNKRTVESLIKAGAFDSLGQPRRALFEAHDRAIDSVLGLKRQEAIGQDSLFGGLDSPASEAFGGVTIPDDAQEWDQKVKLNFEREMLGLYVSSHPLDGAEGLLARNRDASIAELLDSGRTEGYVKVAGIISKIDRKITKAGAMWAIVTVEDLDASIEVLFFPQSYTLFQAELAEDACISVQGRVNDRDGTINLNGQELSPLDLTGIGRDMPIKLMVQGRQINESTITELRRILTVYPGSRDVHLTITDPAKTATYSLPRYQVDGSSAFVSDIKHLFGMRAVESAGTEQPRAARTMRSA
jgi:DNA polymerase III subunit alpha